MRGINNMCCASMLLESEIDPHEFCRLNLNGEAPLLTGGTPTRKPFGKLCYRMFGVDYKDGAMFYIEVYADMLMVGSNNYAVLGRFSDRLQPIAPHTLEFDSLGMDTEKPVA